MSICLRRREFIAGLGGVANYRSRHNHDSVSKLDSLQHIHKSPSSLATGNPGRLKRGDPENPAHPCRNRRRPINRRDVLETR